MTTKVKPANKNNIICVVQKSNKKAGKTIKNKKTPEKQRPLTSKQQKHEILIKQK